VITYNIAETETGQKVSYRSLTESCIVTFFRLVLKSTTLDDLERPLRITVFCSKMHIVRLSQPITKI